MILSPRESLIEKCNIYFPFIHVIDKMIIQKDIINEILHASYYSILVDEITSHNQELMPVIRFVDKNCNIREEFLKFSSLTRLTGKAIASVVVSDLEGLGLDICRILGQATTVPRTCPAVALDFKLAYEKRHHLLFTHTAVGSFL